MMTYTPLADKDVVVSKFLCPTFPKNKKFDPCVLHKAKNAVALTNNFAIRSI